jgi:hypothetical protein
MGMGGFPSLNVKNPNGPNKRASQYYPESHCKNNIIKLDSGFRRNDGLKNLSAGSHPGESRGPVSSWGYAKMFLQIMEQLIKKARF